MSKPIQILAIDDERDVLYTLQAIGARLGWQVSTLIDSTEAVKAFLAIRPDLVLVDYHMPKQDGLTTVKALRRQSPTVPIIVLTVDDRQEIANAFLDAGASDFANKPVKIPDLAARIKVHLQLVQQQILLYDQAITDKGINEATLCLVRAACTSQPGPFLIEAIATQTGLSYQTTVRYLQYLQGKKELTAASDYGKVGRPRKRYQIPLPT